MKRVIRVLCVLLALLLLVGCAGKPQGEETVRGSFRTYTKLSDGTWECEGHIYKHRLEITGRMPNAAADSTFVYLSNLDEIPFERAYLAAGLSSSTDDYFSPEDAVLVEMSTGQPDS